MNTVDYLLELADDDAPAFVDGEATYSYAQLKVRVAACQRALGELGLPAGSPVALVAPNGVFWVAAYLAVLASGLVVVPMPTVLTPDEIAARMCWMGGRVAFAGRREARALGAVGEFVVLGEETLDGVDAAPSARVQTHPVTLDRDAAYLFTSGTTGEPRAVRITHGNLQANTSSILGYLGLDRTDRMLVVLPFSYVFGASLLHTHLRVGAALVNQPSFVYMEAVVDRLEQERCTGIAGVPSHFQLLMRSSSFGSRDLPDLRTIQQAGGRMAPAVADEIVAAHPAARLFVMYGQTEATARLSYLPPDELERKRGSIGRGIPGVDLRVIGESGAQVAPGEIGEIVARGENISPGYLRDPERTAAKMPDGVLRTGDLATVDDEGFIYVVDRTEDFIKSWGHRIASQDVESVVMELSGVIAVAVVGCPDPAAGEKVAAVVVRTGEDGPDAEQIVAHCRRRLAKHMVPEVVCFVPRLPMNGNGKVVKSLVRELCAGREG